MTLPSTSQSACQGAAREGGGYWLAMPSPPSDPPPFPKPRLVLSRCLDLEACRYNGAAIRVPLVRRLEPFLDLMPVCPEVEVGLGVPRDPIRLVRRGPGTALVQPTTGRDLTETMDAFSAGFLAGLPEVEGFLLKARSPSCGIHGVKVFAGAKAETATGRDVGRFARAVVEGFPDHPVEHEGRLDNPRLLDDFLTRMFALADLRGAHARDGSAAGLADAHARHHLTRAMLVLADRHALRSIASDPGIDGWQRYLDSFRRALVRSPLTPGHGHALGRVEGVLAARLEAGERSRLADARAELRAGRLARRAFVEQLRDHAARLGLERLTRQAYLNPYPLALAPAVVPG